MTLLQVMTARKALNDVAADKKLPFKIQYAIAMFLKGTDENEKFWNEQVQQVVAEYGNEDGTIPAEKIEDANKKLNELSEIEASVPMFKMTAEQLEAIDAITLQQVYAILPFIEN